MLVVRSGAVHADLIVYPELKSLIGYPPEDLVLKPALLKSPNARRLGSLAAAPLTAARQCFGYRQCVCGAMARSTMAWHCSTKASRRCGETESTNCPLRHV
jgi:hypothetical protein